MPMYNVFVARYVQMFAVRIRGYSHGGPPSTINIVHNIPLCGDKKKMHNINQVLFVYCKAYTHARVSSVQNVAEWTKTPITDIFLRLYNNNNNNNNITYAPRALTEWPFRIKLYYCILLSAAAVQRIKISIVCARVRGSTARKIPHVPGYPMCVHIHTWKYVPESAVVQTERRCWFIENNFRREYHYYRYRRYCRYGYYYYHYLESASDGRPVKYCMYAVRGPIVTEEMAARQTEFDAIVVLRRQCGLPGTRWHARIPRSVVSVSDPSAACVTPPG